ncbi:zinc-finger-containing protein [Labrys neptuniae]
MVKGKPFSCIHCSRAFSKQQGLSDHLRFKHNVAAEQPARAVAPICDYCQTMSELVTGADIYQHRPDLKDKRLYRCEPCGAWVGCHPGTLKPLGRLANAELRAAKQRAHAAFDPLWKAKMLREGIKQHEARGAAYLWLAAELGIPGDDCHIGMFDVATCQRVVEICAPYRRSAA